MSYRIVFPYRDDLPPVTGFKKKKDAQGWIDARRRTLRDHGLNPDSELDVVIEKE
jgi:hypothetical protein